MSWAAPSRWLPWRLLWQLAGKGLAGRGLCTVIGMCAATIAAMSAAVAGDNIGVIVTNAVYDSGIARVKYADKDGDAIAAAMRQVLGVENPKRFPNRTKFQLTLLFGGENVPLQTSLLWGMVKEAGNPKAHLFVYYSGHGVSYRRGGSGDGETGLLSTDAAIANLEASAYPLQTLRDNLKAIKQELLPEGEVILILEACFSGRTGDNEPLVPNTSQTAMTLTSAPPPEDIIEIDAAQGHQVAFWDNSSQRGLFTDQFLWAIHGEADKPEFGGNGDGKITLREVESYLRRRMPERLERNGYAGAQQTAAIFARDSDRVLSAGPWRRRPDMIDVETREGGMCEAALRQDQQNATLKQLEQHVEALKGYDSTCVKCACRAEVRVRLNDIDEHLRICSAVKEAVDSASDPDFLEGLDRRNECPQLHGALRDTIDGLCRGERERWNGAKREPVEAMTAVADKLRCTDVYAQAKRDIEEAQKNARQLRDLEAGASDLGLLADGRPVELPVRNGDAVRVFKFQLAAPDTVEIQFDGLTDDIDVELRDSSGAVSIKPRQSNPRLKELATHDWLRPGIYYIRVAPAAGRRVPDYMLRAAKGTIDTAGDTPATARDLGRLGQGSQIIREQVGGRDRGDVFRFTAQERMLLKVTVSDMTSDIHLDLLNQGEQVIQTPPNPGRAAQTLEWTVDVGATYYIAVKPSGDSTLYALGISLSQLPYARPDVAAPATLGPQLSYLRHRLAPNADEYWARFTIREPASASIDLRWDERQIPDALHLELFREEQPGRRTALKPAGVLGPGGRNIADELGPGTYFIKVRRDPGAKTAAAFSLNMRSQAVCQAGAPVILTLAENVDEYACRFAVTDRARAVAVLAWNDAAAGLTLEIVGRQTFPSTRGMSTIERVDASLEAGAWSVHIRRAAGSTGRDAVPFRLTLTLSAVSFEPLLNADIEGGDFAEPHLFVGDEPACERACRGRQGCIGYSYNKVSRACYLKRTVDGTSLRRDPILTSAWLHGVRAPDLPYPTPEGMHPRPGFRYSGVPLGVARPRVNGDQCSTACASESKCVGATYMQTLRPTVCMLFERLDGEVPDSSTQSFWKGQASR
jgi:hypothetical protein